MRSSDQARSRRVRVICLRCRRSIRAVASGERYLRSNITEMIMHAVAATLTAGSDRDEYDRRLSHLRASVTRTLSVEQRTVLLLAVRSLEAALHPAIGGQPVDGVK